MLSRVLTCDGCGWRTVSGKDDLASRLRLVGLLRREKDPGEDLIAELLPEAASRMTCPACKSIGLSVRIAESESEGDFDAEFDDWQAAVLCEACRKPIPPERIEALPGARRCLECQGRSEAGVADPEEPEFCPRCGALLELRVSSRGGLTRYRQFCSAGCRL